MAEASSVVPAEGGGDDTAKVELFFENLCAYSIS
jgi:hypothetical protein